MNRDEYKEHLKALGWSYRRVAPVLGVHYVHLALVLSGKRTSARLLAKIIHLPPAPAQTKKAA